MAIKAVKTEREHVADYLGLLEGSERALADALEKVAEDHAREPDIRADCQLLASWSRAERDLLRELTSRYGEISEAEPKRLSKAVSPQGSRTGFGLVRDLHDCWLLATESHISLTILDQAAPGLRDAEMKAMVERMDDRNQRQRSWLRTRVKRAAPQALTVPS